MWRFIVNARARVKVKWEDAMPPVMVCVGNLVIETWPPDDPLAAFSNVPMRRAWAAGSWAGPGGAGRLPDPWQRAAGRPRHSTERNANPNDEKGLQTCRSRRSR